MDQSRNGSKSIDTDFFNLKKPAESLDIIKFTTTMKDLGMNCHASNYRIGCESCEIVMSLRCEMI